MSEKKSRVFMIDGVPHRVVGRRERDDDAAFGSVLKNVLQRKSRCLGLFARWIDVDKEEVPGHVEISMGCTGDGGWQSKFAAHLPFQTRAA